jgi:hypothetical protein
MAQEKFREAVPGAEEIGANVFATAQQIAGGFFLLGRDVNRGERAGAIQDRELAGIAAIRFDPITGATRDQGGGDDVTRNLMRGEGALQLETTGASLVATLHRPLTPDALHEPENRRTVGREGMQCWRAVTGQ